jgi:O-antigen/teichoic acid export membrane protein
LLIEIRTRIPNTGEVSPTSQSGSGNSLVRLVVGLARHVGDVGRAENDRLLAQRNAVTAFLVRIASAGILYLSQVILARWMGAYEYGIYVFVWTWVLVLAGVSQLGFPTAMIRLVPEYIERGEHGVLRGLLLGGRVLAFAAGTAVAGAAILLLWHLGDRITGHYVLPIYLAMACVPLCAVSDVQDGIGRGRGWMAIGLLPPYILRPLLLLGCMTAAHVWGLPATASTAAGSAVLATWIAALVQMLLIGRRFAGEIPSTPRTYHFRRWFKTALPLLVISVCEIALQNTDVLVLSAYMTPAEVGMYFAAAKTMSLVMFIHYAVGSAVANRFSALNVRGDREGLQAFVRDAVRWTFWPSLAGTVVILALGKPLLWLFNPQFTAAYPVMFVLAIGFLMRASMGPAEFILNMLGEQSLCAVVLGAAVAIDIALCFALVPAFGMLGAAVATATALSAAAAMNYVVAKRRLELNISIWSAMRGR